MAKRKKQKRQHKTLSFKAFEDTDQDILDWWEEIEEGQRSDAIRELIREHLTGKSGRQRPLRKNDPVLDIAPLTELARVRDDTTWIREALHDMPSYLERVIQTVAAMQPAAVTAGGVMQTGSALSHDLAQQLKLEETSIISGFHSPVEREFLRVLLRGKQPIVLCPARNIGTRIRAEHKQALEHGRLVFLSPFNEKQRRATAETAQYRNRMIAALATSVFVAYAAPSGHTERLCQEIIAWGKPLYTLNNQANENLIALGAHLMPDRFP